MADGDRTTKLELRGINPLKPFFLATMSGNSDGSVDEPEGEYHVCESVEDAVQYLLDALDDALLDGYVFHVTPIHYVGRGPLRVRPLKDAAIEQRKRKSDGAPRR